MDITFIHFITGQTGLVRDVSKKPRARMRFVPEHSKSKDELGKAVLSPDETELELFGHVIVDC